MSIPMAGLDTDKTPTGSIERTNVVLSPALDQEDLRRAKAALAIALDPQGNGARVAWQNPQSGAHGAFTASAPPFADHDRVCRAFTGEATPGAGASTRLTGSACRDGDGTWQIRGSAATKA
jgi:surface antigen